MSDARIGADVPPATPFLDRRLRDLVGGPTAKKLEAGLSLVTVSDLLHHYPRRYTSFGEPTRLGDLQVGEHVTVLARVRGNAINRTKAGKFILSVVVADDWHALRLAFFATKEHLAKRWALQLRVGTLALFDGKVDVYNKQLQLAHPKFELLAPDAGDAETSAASQRLLAIYPSSAMASSWTVSRSLDLVLPLVRAQDVPDPLPPELLRERGWPSAADALLQIHQPTDRKQVERAQARFRFEEAFVLQTALARRRGQAAALPATPRPASEAGLLAAFDAFLPFTLTAGQVAVGEAVAADLARAHPMHRLLQGEVGSGKTVVALRAILTVVDAGGQAALLAPTEVLAQQHHRSITAMLGNLAQGGMLALGDGPAPAEATRVALLTGSQPAAARRQALLEAASGQAGIVIGTHALLQERVDFFDLGLVVVDEQHRFGVEQRDALRAKSLRTPHLLVMTATPIPRTVAMTIFGDLETSTLKEVPAGRQPVSTHVVPQENLRWVDRSWDRVREEATAGRQVFVVCPRIGESDASGEATASGSTDDDDGSSQPPQEAGRRAPLSVLEVVAQLRQRPALAGLRLEVLHGRMAPDDKDAVMTAVTAGQVDLLVATTVIEVGVDVPNASVMVVMDADRFGISQLHQLRGRIGRGAHPGLCLLMRSEDAGKHARARLDQVADTTDGFLLAHLDLESRREGDVLGAAQSGLRSSLRLLRVTRDEDVIVDARERGTRLIEEDPDLSGHPVLAAHISRLLAPEHENYLARG